MNERIEHCLYQAGLTAQGCWDEFDDYAKEGIEKFAELIVRECYEHCKGQLLNSTLANKHNLSYNDGVADCAIGLLQHFGVKE